MIPTETIRIADATDEELRRLEGCSDIRILILEGQGFTDAGLPHLLALPGLEELSLSGTAVTDAGMATVGRLPRLLGIGLIDTAVTDAGIQRLHDAPRLAALYCELGEGITEDGLDAWKSRRMERFRERPAKEQRREAVYVVESLSHSARAGDDLTRVDWCQQCLVSDGDLEYFTALPEVEDLDLSMTKVTGHGLHHLATLKRLRRLHLGKTYVGSLQGLAGLSDIKELVVGPELGAEPLTDDGTAALATLTGLEHLELPFAEIGDLTLWHLAGLTRLRVLNLAFATGIADDGLAALAGLTRLEHLDLSFPTWRGRGTVTDHGLRYLAGLKGLIVLRLEGQPVTDAGLEHLRGLEKLEHLELRGTQATVAGAERMLTFLPRVSIPVAGTMVKRTNPHPHFTRRDVDHLVSFEIPDDWEVRGWKVFEQNLQIFEKPLVEQFQATLREGGYKHTGIAGGVYGPGEVLFNRFPAARERALTEVHRAFISWGTPEVLRPGDPRLEDSPAAGVEAISWRYQTDRGTEQHLDFGWRHGDMFYFMRCRAPAARFAAFEPLFMHMARSCRFSVDASLRS